MIYNVAKTPNAKKGRPDEPKHLEVAYQNGQLLELSQQYLRNEENVIYLAQ